MSSLYMQTRSKSSFYLDYTYNWSSKEAYALNNVALVPVTANDTEIWQLLFLAFLSRLFASGREQQYP
jgi:hypothetical protein